MQFTFECELVGLSENDKISINDLMLRYCSAKRIAFKRLLDGESLGYVIHELLTLVSLSLNWRYCEHAARDALAEMRSQRELLPLYLSDHYDRIEEAEKKLEKLSSAASPARLSALEKKIMHLSKRKALLEGHLACGTIPKVIFGTRSLFLERAAGKITRERWRDARNNQAYSIGQANQRGNANVRIHPDGERVGINLPHGIPQRITTKGVVRVRNERRWFNLWVPETIRKYIWHLLLSKRAYSVRLIRRNDRYFAHVSFEIHNTLMGELPGVVCAIDSNPEGFALAMVRNDGNNIDHRFFREDRLVYASERKRDALIGGLVSKISKYAGEHGAEAMVIEDLHITKSHRDFGRRANRVIHAFVRKKFLENLLIRCWKEGIAVFSVNPAYTSKIGDLKYRKRYGLSIHEAAALCIGRRFYGHDEKLVEESLTITVKSGGGKLMMRMPDRRVWASIYGYHRPSDPYRAPPGRKGSRGEMTDGGNGAVFTGRPASSDAASEERSDEGERKGGECGGTPHATGNGGEPAPSKDGGKVTASSFLIQRYMRRTTSRSCSVAPSAPG